MHVFMDTTSVSGAVNSSLRRKKTPLAHSGFYGKIMRGSLYLLTFLFPLFFLPWTIDAFEVNKQTILVILTLVSLMAWLGTFVMEKKLIWRKSWLNIIPLLFLVSVLVSSIFSLAGYQTWVGQASQEYTSFLTILVFVLLFFVVANNAGATAIQQRVFFALLISGTISGLLTLLSTLGISFGFMAKGFNTVGTINAFSLFLSFVMILGIGLWLVSQKQKNSLLPEAGKGKVYGVLIAVIAIINVLLLLSIDFWVLWVVNLFGLVLLAGFAFIQQTEFPNTKRFLLPLVLILISVLFLFLRSPVRLQVPVVVSPSYAAGRHITYEVLRHGPISFLFGSGPGTFVYDYAKYHTAGVNNTNFWNVRFDRAKSSAANTAATLGVIGFILWVLFVIGIALRSLSRLIKEREHEEWKVTYVVFSAWAVLVLSQFLYTSNITLQFLFWLFSGLLASQVILKTRETDFSKSPKLGLVSSFGFIVVAVGVFLVLFVTGQRYVSEVAFAKAVKLDRSKAPVEEVIQKLQKATETNGLSDIYYRNLSQALLFRLRNVAAELPTEPEKRTQEQIQQVQLLANASMNAVKRATELEPNNVSNWVMSGSVYQQLMSLVNNANSAAVASFKKAAELEPQNPLHQVNQARVYIATADRARSLKTSENKELAQQAVTAEEQSLASAEEILKKAIELKADYALAHYYLAAVYERQERLDDATTRLVALRNYAPLDVGIGFQLGLLYIRMQNYDLAKAELERVVGLQPKYSNARWYLASIYEFDGDISAAIEQVQAVADVNPDNALVKERLAKLQEGETTVTLPKPVEEGEESATTVEEGEVVEEVQE